VALLRGVNVGGNNKLPMKQLAAELAAIGLSDIKTYIQSGNVVFRHQSCPPKELAQQIGTCIAAKFGFEPHVAVLRAEDLMKGAKANPFPDAVTDFDGKVLHLFFLSAAPASVDEARLEAIRRPSDRWQIREDVFYLHTPEGFHDSKLAVRAEKILGVSATARNWRTVCALLELSGQKLD
jgi:uncharacterized protein (DUF1697 family)